MSDALPKVVLRAAKLDDAPEVARIWHQGWQDGHVGHVANELVSMRSAGSFDERAPRRIDDTTVAIADGQIAGFVMVVGDEAEQVYVDQAFRGRRVADVLLDEVERQVAAAGHAQTWLAVVAGNARARSFYERRGWSDAGLIDYHAKTASGDLVAVPCHRYTKDLPGPGATER